MDGDDFGSGGRRDYGRYRKRSSGYNRAGKRGGGDQGGDGQGGDDQGLEIDGPGDANQGADNDGRGGDRDSASSSSGNRGRSRDNNRGRSRDGERAAARLEEQDPASLARKLVLDSLSRSSRTRGQLAALLARKEVPEDVAEAVLDRFTELGLVDDAAYAEAFTRSRHEYKGLGSRAIAFELRRRSVPDELVQEAVSSLDAETEQNTATRLAKERCARMSGLPREVRARRLAGFLARKGYGGAIVGRAVRDALADCAAADFAADSAGGDADFDLDEAQYADD